MYRENNKGPRTVPWGTPDTEMRQSFFQGSVDLYKLSVCVCMYVLNDTYNVTGRCFCLMNDCHLDVSPVTILICYIFKITIVQDIDMKFSGK